VFEWLDRLDTPFELFSYLSHRNAQTAYLLQHPRAVVAAEARLRRLVRSDPAQLLLHREASPLSRGGLERRLLSSARYSVYDFDDALQWDHGEGGLFRRLAPKAPKALAAVQQADRVIAGNPVLADWASQHNQNVVIIPSCVDPSVYRTKLEYAVQDPPRLGWIGSAGNERYLLAVAPALREVHRRTGARLTLIGTSEPRLGELESMIDRVAWSEATQQTALAELDVGIAPVPDAPYERGKCGYKILQYAAAGVPVAGSPVGVNLEILSLLGCPAPSTEAEWVDALTELLTLSTAARRELGERARAVVERGYSYDAWLAKWRLAVGFSRARAV
jgi:glycosyltransferase involved in cell wall biosynthesis